MDCEAIRTALTYIPSQDRELWLRIGMALHQEFGEAGFDLFDEWSQGASNYDAKAARSAWKSFKGGAVSIRTVLFEARQRGFVAPVQDGGASPVVAAPSRDEDRKSTVLDRPAVHLQLASYWREQWDNMQAIGGTAAAYLEARRCVLPDAAGDLRCSEELRHPSGYVGPGLVALVSDPITREPMTLHRTWIKANGDKADVDPPRLLLGKHRKQGGVIRLFEGAGPMLAVAEGIETALSVARVSRPAWSLIDAGNLAALPVLEGVESLLIAADNDPAGLRAAEQCAERWYRAGRKVRIAKSPVPGEDLNDAARRAA